MSKTTDISIDDGSTQIPRVPHFPSPRKKNETNREHSTKCIEERSVIFNLREQHQ